MIVQSARDESIEQWLQSGQEALRAARGNADRVAREVFAYCVRARHRLRLTPIATWDKIAVQQPGLLAAAGFTADEIKQHELAVELAWVCAFEGWSEAER